MGKDSRRFLIYRQLLRLYPKAYREQYENEMLLTLGDMLDGEPSRLGRAKIWLRTGLDTPQTLATQNVMIMEEAMNIMPRYIKINSIVTGLLLLPALAAIFLSSSDQLLFNQTLFNTWFWSTHIKAIWVFFMPLAACASAILGAVYYLLHNGGGQNRGLWGKVFDVRRNWPLLASGVLAFGLMSIVLFHDSAHCWAQNPIHYFTKTHQVWQCTEGGFLGGKNGK